MVSILCVVPALPSDIRYETLQSIFAQSLPVTSTIILTKYEAANIGFAAKMSLLLNGMLDFIRLCSFDYILRVDGDTVLPKDFLQIHVAANFDAVGYGYAQLIKVSPFIKYMDGKFNSEHDDGYVIEKFKYLGLKSSWDYLINPILKRPSGFHHGSSWYINQGELLYRYGEEPIHLLFYLFRHRCIYSTFEYYGFFKALLTRKKRFDIADRRLYNRLSLYRNPSRFLNLPKFVLKVLRGR